MSRLKLGTLRAGHQEALHWHLTLHAGRVSGRCSDGRTFADPARIEEPNFDAKSWLRGFCTAARMAGWTYEIRGEAENG